MALSADAILPILEGQYADLAVLNAVTIYQGAVVSITAAGYAKGYAGTDTIFAGIADRKADNSAGAAGAIKVRVRRDVHCRQVTLSGVGIANIGDRVYASADDTFTLTAGSNLPVGVVHDYVTTNTCIVEFHPTLPVAAGSITTAKLGGLTTQNPLVFVGKNGAGACTCTGAVVGERVEFVVGAPTAGGALIAPAVGTFEAVITVADQIQQVSASNLSANTYFVRLLPAAS